MNLSAHVTIAEFERSDIATKHGISNKMNSSQIQFAKDLCENVFEKIRAHVGGPIRINSGYRSPAVNRRAGGSASSQHCALNGAAMDLDLHDRELFKWIIANVEFDQAIYEFGNDSNALWFHLSYRKGNNRRQALRAIKKAGKTSYIPFV
jgi:hypothetical protein